MLFGEQEKTRTDQVALASQQLAEVQQLIDEGQWDAAQDKLQTLTTTVATATARPPRKRCRLLRLDLDLVRHQFFNSSSATIIRWTSLVPS